MTDNIKKDIVWRVVVVYIGALLLTVTILIRILHLQFIEKDKWIEKANKLTYKDIIIPANRGDIYADDGRTLASSVPFYEIRMDLKCEGMTDEIFNSNIDSLAYYLSALLKNKSKNLYKRELIRARQRGERYFLIKRKVTFSQLKKLKLVPIFRLGKYKGGFIYIQDNKRVRPFGNLASRTIGYLSKSISGTEVGIEGAYDSYLKGIQGVRLMQKLSGGVWMPVNDENEVEPKDGMDIITTINVNIQDVAQSALSRQLEANDADHGTVVLMEVRTGEVKAIVNLKKDKKGVYRESYNYAIGSSTEPGSTFKLASLIVALENGYVDMDDSVDTEDGKTKYYDQTMADSHVGGYGKITVKEAFEKSSNVGISKIITQHYYGREDQFVEKLYSMNLNEKIGIEIKGEGKPVIKYPGDKSWSGTTLPWMSVGYELRLTPLQILTFYNAIANDGVMVKPQFVKALSYYGETIKTFKPKVVSQSNICSKETLQKAKILLEGVVENGTGRNIRNDNYKIAGKTGTCVLNYWKRKKGEKKKYQASFVGYFPAENPKYSCIVVIYSPSKNIYYGSDVAGPVFKEIADKIYATGIDMHKEIGADEDLAFLSVPYTKNGYKYELDFVLDFLNIPVDHNNVNSEWVITTKNDSCILYENRFIKNNGTVPNVKGMGAKDALTILENAGLSVVLVGRGSVRSQSLKPGSSIKKGDKIVVVLA